MHPSARLGSLALTTALPFAALPVAALPLAVQSSAAQTAPSPAATGVCPASAIGSAAAQAASLRSQLRREAVATDDPAVPPRIAALLAQFKDALVSTTKAAFTCAPSTETTEQIQTTLADVLHANRALASETVYEARGKRDVGAFGSDLSLQVFQLFGKPKIFEVDLRYGVECGDDHLLLVFEIPSEDAGSTWRETLRWDAGHYATVGDAFGDFVLLTPLTGSYQHPVWRYLVAHGRPGCGATPRPSRFALDLLTPSADPAKPVVSWHFEDAYSEGNTVPRLATTEDTIELRLAPATTGAATDPKPGAGTDPATTTPAGTTVSSPQPLPAEQVYRFHLSSTGQIVPDPATSAPHSAPAP